MPQLAGSFWYYLRFIDTKNVGAPVDKKLEEYWMPVDSYVRGVERLVLHLLYARFWHNVCTQHSVVNENGEVEEVSEEDVGKKRDLVVLKCDNKVKAQARARKMSKNRGNVVNADTVINAYGVDALRCYLMCM